MPSEITTHPANAALDAFALGMADDATAELVARHLEVCAECRKRVAARTSDSFVGKFRQVQSVIGTPNPEATDHKSHPTSRPRPAVGTTGTGPAGLPDLGDNYEVQKELGRGGMGTVYLALNKLMNRLEVVKVMNADIAAKPGVAERFRTEIQAAARLNHPNVVTAYSALQPNGGLALAMAYVDGLDLDKQVKQSGPLSLLRACNYAAQAARGLQHALDEGLVHRDIKPSNIMTTRVKTKTVVKVLDFGLAKFKSGAEGPGLTFTGQMMGTPAYIAPEQAMDASAVDTRADVYSLGCTLYFLLAGRPPFGGGVMEVMTAHVMRPPPPLPGLRPEVPAALWAVVAKMMEKKPGDRYQTPGEVEKTLLPFIKPGAVPVESSPTLPKAILLRPDGPEEEEFVLTSDLPSASPVSSDSRRPGSVGEWATVTADAPKPPAKKSAGVPGVSVDVRVDLRMWLLRTRGGIPQWLIAVWATVVVAIMAFGIWWLGPTRGGASRGNEVASVPSKPQEKPGSQGGSEGGGPPVVPAPPPDPLKEPDDGRGKGGAIQEIVKNPNPIPPLKPKNPDPPPQPIVNPHGTKVGPPKIDLGSDWEDYKKAALQPAGSRAFLRGQAPKRLDEWKLASERGDLAGMVLYARHLQNGKSAGASDADLEDAFNLLGKAAKTKDGVAMYLYGRCYAWGYGVKKNEKEAFYWYERAANEGYAPAVCDCAYFYMNGIGVQRKESRAIELYKVAAVDSADAMDQLGTCYYKGLPGVVKQDEIEAFRLFQQAATLGHASANLHLGECYEIGKGAAKSLSKPERWDEAARCYQRAADLGNSDAMFKLGFCYEEGRGKTKDSKTAVHWYREAAKWDETRAMVNLGLILRDGPVGLRNAREAVDWFQQAADLGDAKAMSARGECYREGTGGTEKNASKAIDWFRKAAIDHKDDGGMYNLGLSYEMGYGVLKTNLATAIQWYRQAATAGNLNAKAALKRLGVK